MYLLKIDFLSHPARAEGMDIYTYNIWYSIDSYNLRHLWPCIEQLLQTSTRLLDNNKKFENTMITRSADHKKNNR